jgi:hypothetical protein
MGDKMMEKRKTQGITSDDHRTELRIMIKVVSAVPRSAISDTTD